MHRPVILAVLACAGIASAQMRGSQMPAPLPGIPMTAPPVNHPALAAQPLFHGTSPQAGGSRPATPPNGSPAEGGNTPEPATMGPQLAGRDLKKAVAKVNTLRWHENLTEARAQSAATGKPILWLQALGDLEGFA